MFVHCNGVDLFYKVRGSGYPVLTIHGGPGLSDHREAQDALSRLEDTFALIYYDQRGCGLSSACDPGTCTHRQMVEDVETLRKQLGYERVAVLGGSFGGFIAMEYALMYPENISHLILRGTAGHRGFAEDSIKNAMAAGIQGLTRAMLEKMFGGNIEDENELVDLFERVYPLYFKQAPSSHSGIKINDRKIHLETHNSIFTHCFPSYDLTEKLPSLKVKTLVLCGDGDWVTPPKYSRELAALIPGAELVIFENCGHAVHADCSEAFIKTVTAFLKS